MDKLNEAGIHLRKLWYTYGDTSSYVLGKKEDPNLLIGWLKNKRSLEMKPRICDPKITRKAGIDSVWDGDQPWGGHMSYSPNDYISRVDRDQRKKLGMEDLRYVTQWL